MDILFPSYVCPIYLGRFRIDEAHGIVRVKVMVEDKEAADVVRWIFNEAEKGILQSVIAEKLNAEHIQYLVEVPSEVKNDGKSVKVKVEISGKRFLCNLDRK